MEENTIDSILEALERMARSRAPVDPFQWVEGALKLVVLMGTEHDKLYLLEQKVAKARIELLEGGMGVSAAKMHSEASDEHLEARRLKSKIDRILETVRLAKLRARLGNDEYKAQ